MDIARLLRLVFGDRRDQRSVLRGAGFADEAEAAAWANQLVAATGPGRELALVEAIRRERPDLGLATARYIARQTITRHP